MRFFLTSILFVTACASESTSTTVQQGGDPHTARNVAYDHDASHLLATNVQTALDELAARPSVGPAGAQGPQGPIGATGPQGASGSSVTTLALSAGDANCPDGGTRIDSITGITYACNGATGPIGATGAIGPQGPIGPQGFQGPTGLPGDVGPAGPRGEKGEKGDVGPAGPGGGGASAVLLARPDWLAYGDHLFYGVQDSRPTQSESGQIFNPPIIWVSSEANPFAQRPLVQLRDRSTELRQAFVGFDSEGRRVLSLLFRRQTSGGSPQALVSTGPQPTDGIQQIRLDDGHLGESSTVALPSTYAAAAHAGVSATGEAGGYRPGFLRFFGVTNDGDLLLGNQTLLTSAAMRAASGFLLVETCTPPGGAFRFSGLTHDPATKRIVFADHCNDVVWVLGYEVANGPITFHAVLRLPETGPRAYDPVRRILWTGTHGIAMDLAAL